MLSGDTPSQAASDKAGGSVTHSDYGTYQGQSVSLFTLQNEQGMVVKITNFGGIITSMLVPDKTGSLTDVVIGFDTLQEYIDDGAYVGALVGRYANRIGQGGFTVNATRYPLQTNENENTLHGGPAGLHKKIWQARMFEQDDACGVVLSITSPDGENGFPGTLVITATYTLSKNNSLRLDFEATTDKTTPVSLTNHSYFNLAGQASVLAHQLHLAADAYLPVDETLIPLGDAAPVAGSPFDFTAARPVGQCIEQDDAQLRIGSGYDHNFVIRPGCRDLSVAAAIVTEPVSGRRLELFTDLPGLQFYSGNFLGGTGIGRNKIKHEDRCALALEPQAFPDAPNQTAFPDAMLRPGEIYRSAIIYKLSNI